MAKDRATPPVLPGITMLDEEVTLGLMAAIIYGGAITKTEAFSDVPIVSTEMAVKRARKILQLVRGLEPDVEIGFGP